MKTKFRILTLAACLALAVNVNAQSNAPTTLPSLFNTNGLLTTLESYLTQNDPTFNGWQSNHFTLFEAAAFASVNGVPGASAQGNVLGLEVPIHKWSIHIDSATAFEQLAGDVHSQAVGLGYDYNIHQIHLSAGLDAQYVFTGNHLQAMPYIEFIKMPTTLYGMAPFFRYQYPISRSPGAGQFLIGLALNL